MLTSIESLIMTTKPLFLSIDRLPDPVRAELTEMVEFVEADPTTLEDIVSSRGADVRIISSRGKRTIDSGLLDQLPALGLIACYGVGYEKVSAHAAAERGIMVTHTPDVLNADVADLAVALLLATIRQLPQADRFVRERKWSGGPYPLTATLREKTIGIVGMGRIGQAIGRRLEGFDLDIAYHTRNRVEGIAYRYVDDLALLARQAHVLIVIVPGGAATENIIDAAILNELGQDGVLINVSRGSVVDQDALISALERGVIGGAGLDVYRNEPAVPEALLKRDDVVLLPHIGSATHHARTAMDQLYLNNVAAWLSGRKIPSPIPECRESV